MQQYTGNFFMPLALMIARQNTLKDKIKFNTTEKW